MRDSATAGLVDPHGRQPVLTTGAPLASARSAAILLHGRGASAQDILLLADELDVPGVAYLAPQAAGGTWYPQRFNQPTHSNQPYLNSALAAVERTLQEIAAAGIPREKTVLLGFSQGACLALEYAALHAGRYGGLAGLSGGLIGADGEARPYQGTFEGTPVFLGCDRQDFHIPAERVEAAAAALEQMGAAVTLKLYTGLGHAVNAEELGFVRQMLENLARTGP